MKIYPEELQGYRRFKKHQEWHNIYLTEEQLSWIQKKSGEYYQILLKHKQIHNLLNFFSLLILLILIFFNFFYALPLAANSFLNLTILAIFQGHLIYTISNFTIHEGAAHKLIFIGRSSIVQYGNFIVRNIPRFFFSDPKYYVSTHSFHHNYTGTEKDKAYTHFVYPKRFWLSMIPLAGALPFCDYKIHMGDRKTNSSLISMVLSSLLLLAIYFINFSELTFLSMMYFTISLYTFSFFFDRIRETTEHNLMPAKKYGARSFGLSFWGLVFGGLFWGQPCHFIHHLAPNLPWYLQIKFHYEIKEILSVEQQKFYLLDSFFKFPGLLINVLKQNIKYTKS